MKRVKLSQNGFGIFEGLLLAVLFGLIIFVGWYVWRASNSSDTALPSSTQTPQNTDKYANWKELSSDIAFATLRYPRNWEVSEKTSSQKLDNGSEARTRRTTITSPQGTTIHMYAADGGGGGGQCEPDSSDVPFADGNVCPSVEYLSSEVLPIKNLYHSYELPDLDARGRSQYAMRPSEIVLTTKRYKHDDEKTLYLITVAESTPESPVRLNTPEMGYLKSRDELWLQGEDKDPNVSFWIYAESEDQDFLGSKDAEKVKDTFRSLQFDL